ncbi:WAT1-related protein At1g43650 isoform X1 [Jatropha curcas]|uniref:WAT1-related protein At1g43650 isoform X1 n=1 Tax=Jatropha curcas TaxID=180498 RepID=UPI00189589CC|nr:WAT1-related protein At1g43650 isoform X1 [Jatropha curcas]
MKSLIYYSNVIEGNKPYISVLFIQFVYAGMALFSKAAISKGMNPFVFVVYRQAFASVALAPFAFFLESKKAPPLSNGLLCKIFFVSFFGLAMSMNLYYVAINNTTATFAAATTNIIPAITFIMAALLRIESISIWHVHGIAKLLGSAITVSGALVFAFVKGPPLKFMRWYQDTSNHNPSMKNCCSTQEWIKGSLLMISANILWSLWFVLQGPIVKQYPAKLRLTALQCFFCCIQSAFWAIAVERNPSAWKLGWDVHLLAVAYCGIVVNGISYWLQVWTIEKKGPVFASMFTPLALVITAILSAFLWKETLHWGSVGGAILLVGGLYGVLWGKNKEEAKSVTNEQVAETNEEITLECITHQ